MVRNLDKEFVLLLLVAAVSLLAPPPVRAQTPAPPQSVDELKRRLEQFEETTRQQIEALQRRIAQQEDEITRLRQQAQPTAASKQPPIGPPQRRQTTREVQIVTFNRDRDSAPRIDNAPLDPSLHGFFSIPDTPARVKFDGQAKLDVMFDPRLAGDPDEFITTTIPVNPPPNSVTTQGNVSARQTRFNVDFRSPTRFDEDLRIYFEMDFFGQEGPSDPRLRHFYGQLKNILLGQTWTTFTDPDNKPDTLDLEGPPGVIVTRQAQFRFTRPFGTGHSVAFSVERPDVQAPMLFPNGQAVNPAPDLAAQYRYEAENWHTQISSVYRALGYNDGLRAQTIFGWGINGSVSILVLGRDNIWLNGTYGKGIARYISNLNGLGLDLSLNNDATGLRALPVIAGYAGYQHYWDHKLRSTFTFGYDRVQNTATQLGNVYSKSYYASGNLIWNAVGNLDLGVEFLHGWQVLKNNAQGNANRIQFSAKYDLYRKD